VEHVAVDQQSAKSSPASGGLTVYQIKERTSYHIVLEKGQLVRMFPIVLADWLHSGHLAGCGSLRRTSRSLPHNHRHAHPGTSRNNRASLIYQGDMQAWLAQATAPASGNHGDPDDESSQGNDITCQQRSQCRLTTTRPSVDDDSDDGMENGGGTWSAM
jgi:hypothetical protein